MNKKQRIFHIIRNRQRHLQMSKKRGLQTLSQTGMVLALLLGLALTSGILILILSYQSLTRDLPPIQKMENLLDGKEGLLRQPTVLYDRTGTEIITTLENPGIERRFLQLPTTENTSEPTLADPVDDVFVAVFDPDFWQHGGIKTADLTNPEPRTIAERLVLRFLLADEPAAPRRALRMRILAAQITAQYGRKKVLTWFINHQNFGRMTHGIDSAAQLYFGKSASVLNLTECMILAATAQAPALNPLDAPEAVRNNLKTLTDQLSEGGLLSADEVEGLLNTSVAFSSAPETPAGMANAFVQIVIDQLANTLKEDRILQGGLSIITSLDADLQREIHCTANQFLTGQPQQDCTMAGFMPERLEIFNTAFSQQAQVSIVVQNPQTGQILALLGDFSPSQGEIEQLKPHPAGSLLTPFIYLPAFQRGMGPATLVWDVPSSIPSSLSTYREAPETYQGPMRLREALAADVLAPAAQMLFNLGTDEVQKSLQTFGLNMRQMDQLPYDGGLVSPLLVSDAFAVFANEGVDVGISANEAAPHLSAITWIEVWSFDGQQIAQNRTPSLRPVLSESLTYLMNDILSDEAICWPVLGFPNATEIGRPAAVKLGETYAGDDQWVVGYTPQRIVTVWLGDANEDVTPLTAADLWHGIIQYTLNYQPILRWPKPQDISTVEVCDPSGLLPSNDCPQLVSEIFISGSEPLGVDNLFKSYEINQETGHLATVFTPPAMVIENVFIDVPPEVEDWAEAVGLPQAPDEYDNLQSPPTDPNIHISSPDLFSLIAGKVAINGTAGGDGFEYYRVEAGQGLNPQNWLQISEESYQAVTAGLLTTWDTTQTPDGLYALRLQVIRTDQSLATAITQVTIDNTPPEVHIQYPAPNQALSKAPDQPLLFLVDAQDALGVAHVEWLIDGEIIAALDTLPYHLTWSGKTGSYQLQVRVTDLAGNQSLSDLVTFSVIDKQ
jgi:membrane peptidoglycan carboxypeptidase